MLVLERHLFTFARAGFRSVSVAIPRPDEGRLASLRLPPELDVRWEADCAEPRFEASADYFMRPHALDERLPVDSDRVEDWLMAAGPKAHDGFMARHFDRRISGAVSRMLLDTAVTPNQMTVFSTTLGLIGAAFFLGDARSGYVVGALLIWLHSVLDGCDGELARVRFQESPLGSDLDFWGDNLVHLALFTCLGVGFWLSGHRDTLALSAVADAGVLASAWTAWGHRRARRDGLVVDEAAGDGFESRLSRLENALAQRDFIYLLVVLAALDLVYEFLWAAAVGGCLYFAIMLYLRRVNHNEQVRQPHPAR